MKKNMNLILRKCKSLSLQLGRSSSYSSLRRSDSTKLRGIFGGSCHHHHLNDGTDSDTEEKCSKTIVYVGSKQRRYVVSSEFISHPLLRALIDKSTEAVDVGDRSGISIRCEVVLFDHLLWLLQNGDPCLDSPNSLEELAELYLF